MISNEEEVDLRTLSEIASRWSESEDNGIKALSCCLLAVTATVEGGDPERAFALLQSVVPVAKESLRLLKEVPS